MGYCCRMRELTACCCSPCVAALILCSSAVQSTGLDIEQWPGLPCMQGFVWSFVSLALQGGVHADRGEGYPGNLHWVPLSAAPQSCK